MLWPPPTWTAPWLATMVSKGDGDVCSQANSLQQPWILVLTLVVVCCRL